MSEPAIATTPNSVARARAEFIRAINDDVIGAESARLLAVLDALIAWSQARPNEVRFKVTEHREAAVTYEWIETREILWSAMPARGQSPRLMLVPKAAQLLTDEERQLVVDTLNVHTRDQLAAGDRLRIGFTALKNADARAAILGLLDRLVDRS